MLPLTLNSSIVVPFKQKAVAESVTAAAALAAKKREYAAKRQAWIQRVVEDCSISHLASRVAVLIITKYVNPTSGDAWPKQSTLAAELDVSVRAIQKSLDAVVGARHLHREVVHGRSLRNHYRPVFETENTNAGSPFTSLKDEPEFAIETPKTRTREQTNMNESEKKPEPPFVHEPVLREPVLREPALSKKDISANSNGSGRKTAISKYQGSTQDFESFWQVYPKRVGRLQAEKSYSRIVSSGISADVLVAGAGRYAAERAGDDPRFTKHPATWLNGGCWTDEPQAPSRPAKPKFGTGFQGFLNGGGDE
jgi:hypothetical protein